MPSLSFFVVNTVVAFFGYFGPSIFHGKALDTVNGTTVLSFPLIESTEWHLSAELPRVGMQIVKALEGTGVSDVLERRPA
jgi:hypothetical protein